MTRKDFEGRHAMARIAAAIILKKMRKGLSERECSIEEIMYARELEADGLAHHINGGSLGSGWVLSQAGHTALARAEITKGWA